MTVGSFNAPKQNCNTKIDAEDQHWYSIWYESARKLIKQCFSQRDDKRPLPRWFEGNSTGFGRLDLKDLESQLPSMQY